MEDERILNRSTQNSFVYHLRPCYSSYVRRADWAQEKDAGNTEGKQEDNVMDKSGHDASRGSPSQT